MNIDRPGRSYQGGLQPLLDRKPFKVLGQSFWRHFRLLTREHDYRDFGVAQDGFGYAA
jgi:hypothetical protein